MAADNTHRASLWTRISEAMAGWKALGAAFVVGAVLAGVAGEFWRAPALAEQARRQVQEAQRVQDSLRAVVATKADTTELKAIRRSVESLEETFRIYACGDASLDRSAYVRLDCNQYEGRAR
jgi:hypothetical protein